MKFSLIPKRNKREIYEYLFREGVMVVKKDPKLMEHPELKSIPNLHVMMSLKSLKSSNYVTEKFNWQHYYYVLTNEGIEHLRDVLQLPSNVHPATYTRKARAAAAGRIAQDGANPRDEMWHGNDGERRFRGDGRGRRHFDNARGGFAGDYGYTGASNAQ